MLRHSWKLITAALILSLSAIAAMANDAGSSSTVTFDVPFDFQIGNDKYEAGTYRVKRENQNAVLIESVDGKDSKFILAGSSGDSLKSFAESKLTFFKYGDRYFLRRVNSPTISAYVIESRDEKEVRKSGYEKLAKVMVKANH